MAEISNPRYSRPIDVHRWSDHPEVKALVEEIWEDYLPWQITGKQGEKRPGISAFSPKLTRSANRFKSTEPKGRGEAEVL